MTKPATHRIRSCFEQAQAQGRAALVGYLTAHDPDLAGSRECLFAACDAGLDLLELGLPFSDPTADGPTIQAAMLRARQSGGTFERALELCAEVRKRFDLPIVLFSYANPLLARGEKGLDGAREAGADGLLVVDLPPEHAQSLRAPAAERGLRWVGLCAPTSTPERRERVLSVADAFVYAVSLTGVTGAKLDTGDPALHRQLAELRQAARSPVVVGFGLRTPEQIQSLAGAADGLVVGSALVQAAQRSPQELSELVTQLAAATRR